MSDDGIVHLGKRLREARDRSGLSLRAVARELDFSPSFLSQIENGKSQPSVGTLYDLARLLDVPIDVLFRSRAVVDGDGDGAAADYTDVVHAQRPAATTFTDRDSGAGAPVDRVSVQRAGEGQRLELDSGVVWTQLATNTSDDLDFMEIVYPVGAASTSDGRMLRHVGFEYGYLIEGRLEVTAGFDVTVLEAGDSLGLDSSIPHLFRNVGDVPARGIWCVHHMPSG